MSFSLRLRRAKTTNRHCRTPVRPFAKTTNRSLGLARRMSIAHKCLRLTSVSPSRCTRSSQRRDPKGGEESREVPFTSFHEIEGCLQMDRGVQRSTTSASRRHLWLDESHDRPDVCARWLWASWQSVVADLSNTRTDELTSGRREDIRTRGMSDLGLGLDFSWRRNDRQRAA